MALQLFSLFRFSLALYNCPTADLSLECSGHGKCSAALATCTCYSGWGAPGDVAEYKQGDCAARTCPAHASWTSTPLSATLAHSVLAECSDMGTCDRSSGACKCFSGFTGDACQRKACPTATSGVDCSGHGSCVTMKQAASMANAMPVGASATYGAAATYATSAWDADIMYGCVCDSPSWTVGVGSGETQLAEYWGPDCSLRRCPSADNPMTIADETDCNGVNGGGTGNKCHVECSMNGRCDHKTGTCKCFSGFYGQDCASRSVLAKAQAK
mgnify:FL=1|jgi:hypothetical protein